MEQEKPAPERKPEPAPRDDVRVAALSRCPFCHADAGVAASRGVCAACLARHHDACWEENGRCSSCGHTVRLELPRPKDPTFNPLLALISAILLVLLGVAGMAYSEARTSVIAVTRQLREAESLLVAERTEAATAARRHDDSFMDTHAKLREAHGQAAQAQDEAAKARADAASVTGRLNTTLNLLRQTEERAVTAELRVRHLEGRVNDLETRSGTSSRGRTWSRPAARVEAQGRLRLALALPIDSSERVRLDLAAAALEPKRDGELTRLQASAPTRVMFAATDHPQFEQQSARALEQLRDPREPLERAYAGHVKLVRGDLDGAMHQVHRALDQDPTCGLAWIVRAQVRLARRDFEGAFGDVVVGEALDDGWSSWSLFTRARIHAGAGRPNSAIQDLEALQALGTGDGLGLDLAVKALLQQQRAVVARPR